MQTLNNIMTVIGWTTAISALLLVLWLWLEGLWDVRQGRKNAEDDDSISAQINGEKGKPDYAMTLSSKPHPPEPECQSAAPESKPQRVTAPASIS